MKQLLIISILLLFSLSDVLSQSISFDELTGLISKNNTEIDKVLKGKLWSFNNETIKNTYTKYTWNYNNTPAGIFVFIKTTDNNNTVTYKTSDNKCYNEFMKLINSGSFKLLEKYEISNRIINFYVRDNNVVELEKVSGVLSNNQTLYSIGYMKIETYKMLKEFR